MNCPNAYLRFFTVAQSCLYHFVIQLIGFTGYISHVHAIHYIFKSADDAILHLGYVISVLIRYQYDEILKTSNTKFHVLPAHTHIYEQGVACRWSESGCKQRSHRLAKSFSSTAVADLPINLSSVSSKQNLSTQDLYMYERWVKKPVCVHRLLRRLKLMWSMNDFHLSSLFNALLTSK